MGRPRKEKIEAVEAVEVVQDPVDVQTEEVVFDTSVPLEVEPVNPPSTQRDRVESLIDNLRGSGMQVMFDDDGVTFKRGVMVEFINYSSSDRLIVNAATRIARPA